MDDPKRTVIPEGMTPDEVYRTIYPTKWKPDTSSPPRECILKLGQKITDRIGVKVTVEDPEYWGLAGILTDEMAELALKMKVRVPYTFDQLLPMSGMDAERLEKVLGDMSYVGILEYNWENPTRTKQWVLPMFVPGSAEFGNMNPEIYEKHPEISYFFERMSSLPIGKIAAMVPPGGAGIGMHVIPVEKAIEAENTSVDIEHISHWLDKYEGKLGLGKCSCRVSRRVMGEGCADDPDDWCIGVGDMADYCVQTGKGHYATKEEVLEVLQRAEDNGFVHQITNIDGENKIFAICNCNVNVCYALRTSQLFNAPNLSRSAYVAHIDKQKCVACGRCVEHCPAGALKLGQKLCTTHGEIEYPQAETPDLTPWGPHKWNIDYRDTHRINCHDTGTSPCKTACPAHIAVQGYLKLASQGRYIDALALIKKENPFPAVCGRICNHRCEDACTRGTVDDPIAIDDVKRFLADLDLAAETRYIPPKVIPSNKGGFPEKVAIVGAGPAGLTCAFFLAEKGYAPTVFEKNERPGGMLVYGIPAYKLEKDVVDAEIDVIRAMGVDIRCGVEVGRDVTLDELRAEGYKAFYIAIGCQGGRSAGIPGEDAEGVAHAVSFLHDVADRKIGKLDGSAVVIGGGNVAIDVARTAVRCGAETQMFCLESREEMPASDEEVAEAVEDGVHIECGWGPAEVLVEDGRVRGIVLKRCTSVFDADGRFSPTYDEDDTMTVECEHVLLSIGQSVVWGDLLAGSKVELGRGQGAVADELTYQTAEPDIFVGGDVYTGPKFAIDAIAAGKQGAESIHRFVQPAASLTIGRNRRNFIELDKDDIVLGEYDTASRQVPGTKPAPDGPRDLYHETRTALTEEQVKIETARCLGCGATIVDPNRCIGCGVCTTKCEFDAVTLHRDRPECSTMVKSEDKLKKILPYAAKRAIKIKLGLGKKR